ncbi:hypothetical protein N185_30565 [Sinorhizobium sp. GW3]|nr:hypothetical protein N185_30565 [Sinorhizobium sp. GW3]
MEAGKLRWRDRLALLAKIPSQRIARQLALKWQEDLTPKQLEALNHHAALILSEVDPKIPREIVNLQTVLANPFLVHYIRPAVRMARKNGYEIGDIPIITNPSLTCGGEAVELAPDLRVVELPFGLIFMLREIGRGIVSLSNAMQRGSFEKTKVSAYLCATISLFMFHPLGKIYPLLKRVFDSTTLLNKIRAAQATHILGVFLILHEIGHICCNHDLSQYENEKLREQQEHEADLFAVDCMLAVKRSSPRFSAIRDAMLIHICGLFVLMDIGANETGLALDGYPSFKSRYQRILENVDVSAVVRGAVRSMDFEVQMAVKPANERIQAVKKMIGL